MSLKFSTLFHDTDLQRMQREIEDNLVDKTEIDNKAEKTGAFSMTEPVLKNMKDGDEAGYDDGTNKWLYRRIGAKLYKWQLTEV